MGQLKSEEPCSTCGGKEFLNPDGTKNNAFEGSDGALMIPCPDCRPDVIGVAARSQMLEKSRRDEKYQSAAFPLSGTGHVNR